MLTDRLRLLARGARHFPDRMLHPFRRRATAGHLARQPLPRRVLFVCHGNICRSPYAAAVARGMLPKRVAVESAGFMGPGRPSPPEAVAVAAERGIDLTPHRSRLITAEALKNADLVVVMDQEQRRSLIQTRLGLAARVVLLGDLDPTPITRRAVPDPVEQPVEAFRSSYDRIDRCVRALSALWSERTGDDTQS